VSNAGGGDGDGSQLNADSSQQSAKVAAVAITSNQVLIEGDLESSEH